jgi:hypothetical protein
MVVVPVLLEGLALRGDSPLGDRAVRLHLTIVAAVLIFALALGPLNFGSRFLLGIAPSGFCLAAWALAGYWRGAVPCGQTPLLPTAATCLIGFGLGILVANAPVAHEIPPRTLAHLSEDFPAGYLLMLPREIGNGAAGVIVVAGVAGVALGRSLPRPAPRLREHMVRAAIVFWTIVLFAALVPLVLGPYALRPRGLFEVHMVALAALALIAWQHRQDRHVLEMLRFAALGGVLVAGLWQAGFLEAKFDLLWLARVVGLLPAVLVVVGAAGTTRSCQL